MRADADNAWRVRDALEKFGAPLTELTLKDLSTPGIVFQIGVPPNRIDIVTEIDGVAFAEGWESRITTRYGDQLVTVIGLDDLIRNKQATGRPQDALDAETLRQRRDSE